MYILLMSKSFNDIESLKNLIKNMQKQIWDLYDNTESIQNLVNNIDIYNNDEISKYIKELQYAQEDLDIEIANTTQTVYLRNNVYCYFSIKDENKLEQIKEILPNIEVTNKEEWFDDNNKLGDINISVFNIEFCYSYWGSEGECGEYHILYDDNIILEKEDHIYNLDLNDIKEDIIQIIKNIDKNIDKNISGNINIDMVIDIMQYIIEYYIYEDKLGIK